MVGPFLSTLCHRVGSTERFSVTTPDSTAPRWRHKPSLERQFHLRYWRSDGIRLLRIFIPILLRDHNRCTDVDVARRCGHRGGRFLPITPVPRLIPCLQSNPIANPGFGLSQNVMQMLHRSSPQHHPHSFARLHPRLSLDVITETLECDVIGGQTRPHVNKRENAQMGPSGHV